jgi:signal transduction histidine kinase
MSPQLPDPEHDDRGAFLGAGLTTLAFFSLVAFTQWVTFSVWGTNSPVSATVDVALLVISLSFFPSAVLITVFATMHGYRWRLAWRALGLAALPVLGSAARLLGLRIAWGEGVRGLPAVEELVNGVVPPLLALVVGLYYIDSQDRTRRIERLIAQREVEAQKALSDLEAEEMRVRRDVYQTLHGRIQQRLVFAATRLAAIVPQAERDGRGEIAIELGEVIDELDSLRESDVRQLSHELYPTGLDIGLQPAIQLRLARVPAAVAVTYTVAPEAAAVDDVTNPELTEADRMLLASLLEEGVTNALKHGASTALDVRLSLEPGEASGREQIVFEIDSNGTAPPPDAVKPGTGLGLMRRRLAARGGGLALTARGKDGGSRLRFWIPRPEQPASAA